MPVVSSRLFYFQVEIHGELYMYRDEFQRTKPKNWLLNLESNFSKRMTSMLSQKQKRENLEFYLGLKVHKS